MRPGQQLIPTKRTSKPQVHAGLGDLSKEPTNRAKQGPKGSQPNTLSSGGRQDPTSQQSSQLRPDHHQSSVSGTNLALVNPSQAVAKEGSEQLQHNLKDLKENYLSIESQIVQETKKQRDSNIQKYSGVLEKIQSLKKLLKTEVEQRKNTEEHFKALIDEKADKKLNSFTVQYLNKLHLMRETVESFESRKQNLEQRRIALKKRIQEDMLDAKEEIVGNVKQNRANFEHEYQKQVDLDIKELKKIGELKHNFEQMTEQIASTRELEFHDLHDTITQTIKNHDIYAREESIRGALTGQINLLKDRKCTLSRLMGRLELKLEMQSRSAADNEIQEALQKYQEIIQQQVEKQRQEIKKPKNASEPTSGAKK